MKWPTTTWQHVSGRQHHLSGLKMLETKAVLEKAVEIMSQMAKAGGELAEGVITTRKRIPELEKLTLHNMTSPFRWSGDMVKLAKRLTELGNAGIALARTAATIYGLWGGDHKPPQLPPKE
jgi:hypothetical protein